MQKPHVLIVEDEAAISELIAINLRHGGFTCDIAADTPQAKASVFERMPDLVLLDWMLPTTSGFALAKEWRSQSETKDLPIIMLTARADEKDKVAGLEAGMDDYITKPFSIKELLARVRAMLRRKDSALPQAQSLLRSGRLELDVAAHRVRADGHDIKLGKTEFSLLQGLLSHSERAMDRDLLKSVIWGRHSEIDSRTIDVHIKRLREAIALVSVNAALQIETVRGLGYRLSSTMVAVPNV
jgi:two-component system, OmpR family, phosphate regulon response regulator PhoB